MTKTNQQEKLLTMLKANLQIITDYMDDEAKAAKDEELMFYINTAKEFIAREGITLIDSVGDSMLIVMYAGWLYDRRKAPESNQAMPRMLRWNLNNRIFEESAE